MRLTVLGSSGTYAAPGNPCSGYLVRSGDTSVLVDAGPGTLAALQEHIDPAELDAVLISHSHPDHWVEAPVLRNALRYVIGHEGLAVHTTEETMDLIASVCHERVAPTFEMSALSDGSEVTVGSLTVRCSRTDHPPETLAFGITDGTTRIAYSADTGPGWSFAELGDQPLDLGICEATFREGSPQAIEAARSGGGVHMTAAQAGAMARDSGARALMITHLLPGADPAAAAAEAAGAYGADVTVATSGLTLDL